MASKFPSFTISKHQSSSKEELNVESTALSFPPINTSLTMIFHNRGYDANYKTDVFTDIQRSNVSESCWLKVETTTNRNGQTTRDSGHVDCSRSSLFLCLVSFYECQIGSTFNKQIVFST